MPTYAAVDLGATSGRVVNVTIDAGGITLDEVSRFGNHPIPMTGGGSRWDVDALLDHVRAGLVEAAARTRMRSVAIDSWAVDYGLLDHDGRRCGPVHSYRSTRADGVMDDVVRRIGSNRIYAVTGTQFLAFNTIYQLASAQPDDGLATAASLLMVPDLFNHELCGSTTNEVTNASTTQLLDARSHEWSDELIDGLGLPRRLFPGLHEPGTLLGTIDGVDRVLDGLTMVAAASHDTASAVAGTPIDGNRPAVYISCGTWSLVGCELSAPITTPAARAANVTNELGIAGTTRLLKNVTGLWLLEECRRAWDGEGGSNSVVGLVAAAAEVPGGRSVIDPDDARFAAPGAMPDRIADACAESGQPRPQTQAEVVRVILDSLALAWRVTVRTIEAISGVDAEVIHLVGGGSANPLLRELCASACARPVLSGPTEATVVGNAMVQAIADGEIADLASGRRLVRWTMPPTRTDPATTLDWDRLEARLRGGR